MSSALIAATAIGILTPTILLTVMFVQKVRMKRLVAEAIDRSEESLKRFKHMRFFDSKCWMCGMECVSCVSVPDNDIPDSIDCPSCEMLMMKLGQELIPPLLSEVESNAKEK